MNMKRILLLLLSLPLLFSCSVKEDRGDCPCLLYVHSETDIPEGDVLVSIVQNGKVVNQGTMTRAELQEGSRCFSVPRAVSVVTLISGISAMVPLGERTLLQREGNECDEIWSFSEYVDVRGDEYHHYGLPHKNFARLSIAFAGEMKDADITVSGTTNGYDILDTSPLKGNSLSPLRPSARDREFVVRLPRQIDNSLILRVVAPDSEARLIAVGEMIRQMGYNWEEEDLLDIRLTVDLGSSSVRIGISDWDPVEYDIVETGTKASSLCLTPIPPSDVRTKAWKTMNLSEPIGFFGTIASSFRDLSGERPEFAFNERFTLSQSGVYKPDNRIPPVLFLSGMSAVFHAYSPYAGAGISFSSPFEPGPPVLHFETPSTDQYDLLCGISRVYESGDFRPGECLGNVHMALDHILSCVTVRTSADGMSSVTVKSVTLEGVYGSGDYNMGDCTWANLANASSFTQNVNVSLDGTPYQDILSASAGTAFMLVPQRVPVGALLKLVVQTASGDRTMSTSIAGDTWPQGRDFVYVLSLDDNSGNTTISPYEEGGDQNEQL